jgi:hypothetical protein
MGVKTHAIEGGKTMYRGGKTSGNENFELGSNKSNFRGGKNLSIEGEKIPGN